MSITGEKYDEIVGKLLKEPNLVSICPEIWIEPAADQPSPFYALYINGDAQNAGKSIVTIIHPTDPAADVFIVNLGLIPTAANGNFITTVGYQPEKGGANPTELEIQIFLPGCEMYKERLPWPE